jgi:hypothetical protein
MTIALVAAAFFGGNIEASRSFLEEEYAYIKKAISKSRFNRRLHAIDPCLWRTLFDVLAEVFKHEHSEQTYVVDSLPVAVCDKSSASAAASSILQNNTAKPSVVTLSANAATSTVSAGAPGDKRQGRAGGVVLTGGGFGGRHISLLPSS